MIQTWQQRCEEHPDHQTGMVSVTMIQARMQEEIDDLRAALAEPEQAEPVANRGSAEAVRIAIALEEGDLWTEGNCLLARDRLASAAELRRFVAEHEEDQRVIAVWRGRTQRAEAQIAALLEALKTMLTHMGMDEDEWNKLTFDQARAAIKMTEEGK